MMDGGYTREGLTMLYRPPSPSDLVAGSSLMNGV